MDALIVDDDAAVRAFLGRLLAREGWQVVACAKSEEALSAAASSGFRLAFVDVHLGIDDGIALARSLRKRHPRLSVVLMSGSGTHEERARRVGLEPIMLKPLSAEAVCAVLGACDREPDEHR